MDINKHSKGDRGDMTAASQMCFVGPMHPPQQDHTHQPQWKALRAVRNPPLIQRMEKDQICNRCCDRTGL